MGMSVLKARSVNAYCCDEVMKVLGQLGERSGSWTLNSGSERTAVSIKPMVWQRRDAGINRRKWAVINTSQRRAFLERKDSSGFGQWGLVKETSVQAVVGTQEHCNPNRRHVDFLVYTNPKLPINFPPHLLQPMETPASFAVVSFHLFKILSATLGFVSVQTRADSIFGMLTRRRELLHNTDQSSHKKIHHTFSRLTWQDKIAVGCRSCQATYWLPHLLSVNFLFVSIQRRITKGGSPPFKKKKACSTRVVSSPGPTFSLEWCSPNWLRLAAPPTGSDTRNSNSQRVHVHVPQSPGSEISRLSGCNALCLQVLCEVWLSKEFRDKKGLIKWNEDLSTRARESVLNTAHPHTTRMCSGRKNIQHLPERINQTGTKQIQTEIYTMT